MDLLTSLSKLKSNVFLIRNDDDFADRLNYRYTVAILVTFAFIVSNRQFSESVIKCWVPAFFTSNYETYANQVCWVSNTYYVNQTQNVPKSDENRKSSEIKYYQWIPFILLLQALFLYIPRILWQLLSRRAGLDLRDLIEAAHSYKSVEKYSKKEKIMDYIVQNIDQYASNPRRSTNDDTIFNKIKFFGESLFCGSGIYLGNYLVTTYFFIKIVYLVNSVAQFFVMNEFLGKQFHELGLDMIRYLTNSQTAENTIESIYFPKVVMCDFRIREFGHPNFSHRYTIQCVLPINLYNQQIFTLLWFWFLILFFANFWALCQWANRMMPKSRIEYVRKRLNMLPHFKQLMEYNSSIVKRNSIFGTRSKLVCFKAKEQRKLFIEDYLKFDGVFILRMISMLTSEIVGTELLHELWKKKAPDICNIWQVSANENQNNFYNNDFYGRNGTNNQYSNNFNNEANMDYTKSTSNESDGENFKEVATSSFKNKFSKVKRRISDFKMRRKSGSISTDIKMPMPMPMPVPFLTQISDNSVFMQTNPNSRLLTNRMNTPRQSLPPMSTIKMPLTMQQRAASIAAPKRVAFSPSIDVQSDELKNALSGIDDVIKDLNLEST